MQRRKSEAVAVNHQEYHDIIIIIIVIIIIIIIIIIIVIIIIVIINIKSSIMYQVILVKIRKAGAEEAK